MPELPEVETVMRGLAAVLEGRRITEVEQRRPDLRFPFPPDLPRRMEGRRVLSFRRRAKYMLMRLEGGESLLIHLGMSGRMVARQAGAAAVPRIGPQGAVSDARGHNAPPEAHEHLVIATEDGWRVGFVDPRRFGSVDLVATAAEDLHRLLAGLGPEPLEDGFTDAVLSAALVGRHTPIKAALLDQTVVAGLGNIYVCEALFRAGISPRRLAASVAGVRAARLVPAIKAVLAESIGAGGSSLRDYVRADGELGRFQETFAVYGREGAPCPHCAAPIQRIVQSGRSTFFCARAQR
ncbi:bifunctional DNA-formamidopyrimidine glycosylase/DNA-(apurinic or apyrimidinic site) lyase [Roseomonas fluvialis]|uniref:Formamidopyrimidine-DNA glycosylase n=1 Tax=Roseomonas fluvialis TaxID=1750527 RepID=A0ABM7YB67_9PROT|nr:bifunctional DNA-formamidopyrimidine glycosylase/DNA-(apurinic or apyrimidinic site) lyase [Roseomonas fluvialis]BDG75336.1 formamidopyrimidine-DNA glycosylase [Roseomonas fluvialis]